MFSLYILQKFVVGRNHKKYLMKLRKTMNKTVRIVAFEGKYE